MLKSGFSIFSYPNVLSAKECRTIIQKLEKQSMHWKKGAIGADSVTEEVRRVMAIGLTEEHLPWVHERIFACCVTANETYKVKINQHLTQKFEMLKYGPGGHYQWHRDTSIRAYVLRELSVVVQLSRSKDYTGGNLLIQQLSKDNYSASREQGTVIIFPSYLAHCVEPVKKGTRYSLVAWVARPENMWDKLKGKFSSKPADPTETGARDGTERKN